MKTIKFYTLGCKVNQYDTQEIRERLLERGFKEINDGRKADVCVVNTCTVTHRADSDSLGFIRKAKRENPKAKIIVTGCLTELDSEKIRNVSVDIHIIKNSQKHRMFELLKGIKLRAQRSELRPHHGISRFDGHTRAFLKIQDGCNNLCSYCKVPLVRGRSRSKPLSQIRLEAERLARNSFKEIVLCGICLGSFGKDLKPAKNLVDAINAIEGIEGILRIRLSSIEAADVSDGLITKLAESKKLCRHLHIPIQSGDDEILKKMNRRYTRNQYLDLIKNIKQSVPGIAITTDVLVGFPGESEDNFKNTLKLVKEIMPLRTHVFPYSRRQATVASRLLNEAVSPAVIKGRVLKLRSAAEKCALNYQRKFLRKNMDVLIESRSREIPGLWEGHADNYLKIAVKAACTLNLKNRLISLKLTKLRDKSLVGFFKEPLFPLT